MKVNGEALYGIWLLTVVLLFGNGCATAASRTVMHSAPDNRVVLSAGDVIDVKFFYSPELNDTQTVRPDGIITLQLVGDVKAQGLTPDRLRSVLTTKYSRLIEKPEVAVIVRRLSSRAVYVTGEVKRPTRIDMGGQLTALEAVMYAGGFNPVTAKPSRVIVIRQTNGEHRGYALDLNAPLKGGPRRAFYLHSQDIVYVPRSTIVNVNQWIDQYINNVVPQFGVRITAVEDNISYTVDTTDYRR